MRDANAQEVDNDASLFEVPASEVNARSISATQLMSPTQWQPTFAYQLVTIQLP